MHPKAVGDLVMALDEQALLGFHNRLLAVDVISNPPAAVVLAGYAAATWPARCSCTAAAAAWMDEGIAYVFAVLAWRPVACDLDSIPF